MRNITLIVTLVLGMIGNSAHGLDSCAGAVKAPAELEKELQGLSQSWTQKKSAKKNKDEQINKLIEKLDCELTKTAENPSDQRRIPAVEFHSILTDVISIPCARQKDQIEFNQKSTGTSETEIQAPYLQLALGLSAAYCSDNK